MAQNPLQDTPEREKRIRQRAHQLWDADGRPQGRDQEYRHQAEFLIGIEDNPGAGQLPNPVNQHEPIPGVTVEEAQIQQNYGEFPDRFADQGEWRQTPMTKDELRQYEEGKAQPTRGDAP